MASLNSVSFIGNLAADPIVKIVNNQTVCNFRIAVNEMYKDQERTTWVNCSVWNDTTEYVMEHLKKGTQVYVSGKLEISSWDRPVTAPVSKEVFTIKTDMYAINCDTVIATAGMRTEMPIPVMEEVPVEHIATEAN